VDPDARVDLMNVSSLPASPSMSPRAISLNTRVDPASSGRQPSCPGAHGARPGALADVPVTAERRDQVAPARGVARDKHLDRRVGGDLLGLREMITRSRRRYHNISQNVDTILQRRYT
jgi:hypothetical protein